MYASAAGYATSYKEFASSLNNMYKYENNGAKSAAYRYTGNKGKSKPYGYETRTKSKAYPAAYKRSEYKKGVNGYGKTSGESYKKTTGYTPQKSYAVTKSDYYKPTSGYNRPYAGKYNPKPSAYITPYTGKYTPKPSGYGNTYPGKYNPAPGGYGGNYGGNGGYAGGNYGNYGIAVIVDKSPLIPKKKKTQDQISRKRVKDDVKLTRDIKNRLGSLESMFGTGQRSRAKPKSRTVTTKKAAQTKKTVKTVKRSTRA
ncbi:MAG: hypothetical protein LLG05_14420 [Porphyromonadaceae bacterium]|nr:hypothetical protein [Porphyromonadaceae bacterium]